jgi:RNA polymerase sigma-70 factor (ECF subfamily)
MPSYVRTAASRASDADGRSGPGCCIVTNLALNEARARSRRGGLWARLTAQPIDVAPAPERQAETRERQESVIEAINELPMDDRVVLYLRYFLELPEAEIATAIGKRPGTVKSRLSRASTRLRAVIEQRHPDLQPSAMTHGSRS